MAITAVNEQEKALNKAFRDSLRALEICNSLDKYCYEDRVTSGSPVEYWHIDGLARLISEEDQSALSRAAGQSWSNCITRRYSNFNPQEEHKMYVYDVVVVDKQADEIVFDRRLVASTGEQAKILVMAEIMRESAPTDEAIVNYHFVVSKMGEGYSK
jgi:hypothetical protein